MKLAVVILAAGQGKRMKSDLPKVLQPLAGEPAARACCQPRAHAEPSSMHVVYGHGGDAVREALAEKPTCTGRCRPSSSARATPSCRPCPNVADDELVLVLYGDVPLIRAETLRQLIDGRRPEGHEPAHRDARRPDGLWPHRAQRARRHPEDRRAEGRQQGAAQDPRMQQRHHGRARQTTAQVARQAQERQRAGRVLPHRRHRHGGERQGEGDAAHLAHRAPKCWASTTKSQLAEVEALHRAERARELMLAGATLADPARIDVRGEVTLGRDVFIDANVLLEGKVTLGDRVRIGPNCVLRDVCIGADSGHASEFRARAERARRGLPASGRSRACGRLEARRAACTSAISSSSRKP